MKVAIVGRGKLGTALARALERTSHEVRRTAGRRPARPALRGADVIVLAVPDAAIAKVASVVASDVETKAIVVHCAGARTTADLEPCRQVGARVAVLHPMVSFADRRRPPPLAGAVFVGAGEDASLRALRRLVRSIDAELVAIPAHGPAYHAAAALAANGAAALAWVSVSILERCGLERGAAERAIGGMLGTVAVNVASIGVPRALTGPVVRGDVPTVEAHRRALRALDPGLLAAYDAFLPPVLACAESAGLPTEVAETLRRLPSGPDQGKRGGRSPLRKSSAGEGNPMDSRSKRR